MIGFWSHIKESESSVAQDTSKLANKIHDKGSTSWFTRKHYENSRNRRDKPRYSWRVKKLY